MQYKIELNQMEFRALHGCYDMEQKVGNRYHVDLEITTELGDLAECDDVTKAVSYLTVYEVVREQMGVTCHMIEAVAMNIITAVKAQFPQIIEVKCRVAKLAPPLGGKLKSVSVTLIE
ncbi:MAG: dihydroneopterin aldolase [Rikenellaceae bacterium]